MAPVSGSSLGERVAEYRRRRGLSQRELAAEVRRSESWVSQVERDVQPVERLSVLQTLADALGVSIRDLRPEAATPEQAADTEPVLPPNDLDGLRLELSGHPALGSLFDVMPRTAQVDLIELRRGVETAWTLAHASLFADLSQTLVDLLPRLEATVRSVGEDEQRELHNLRARAYQAAAAAFARQDEPDAAWVAADRAITAAEQSADPLEVVASMFRMAHAFIRLQRFEQAERVTDTAIEALRPLVARDDCPPPVLSLYGAMHLVQATISAREGQRNTTRQRIEEARRIGSRLGEDRNDFDTEFGPTNVKLHAVAVAADLGDAGEALDIAKEVDASGLSPERQARFLLDVARAHAQRRHVGEATAALLDAERLAPEQIRTHHLARDTIRDLVQYTGRRTPDELAQLARRSAATP